MFTKLVSPFTALAALVLLTASVPNAYSDDASDVFMLEEITVTAEKREENQQKVAVPMQVFTGTDLTETGQNNVDEILEFVSGAVINKAADGYRISIRGISDDNEGERGAVQTTNPTVALNKDGVYSSQKSSGSLVFDLERVEVLMGPQSTLYSSPTPGGIVNVVSASPKLGEYSGSGLIEVGSYSLLHTEGSVNIPVSDTFAVRGAYTTSVRDGYIDNGGDDEDVKAVRLKTLWQPNERFSLALTGEMSKTKDNGITGVESFDDQDETDDPWHSEDSIDGNMEQITERKIYTNMDYDFGFMTSTVIASYGDQKNGGTSTGTTIGGTEDVTTESDHKMEEKSIEARFISSEDFPFEWIAGFVYYKSTDDSASDSDDGSWSKRVGASTAKAVYANITYPITDIFRATGGIRYSDDSNDLYSAFYPDFETGLLGENTTHQTYNDPSYKLGVEYDLDEDVMLYAAWSTSYRLQMSAVDEEGNQFPPEEIDAYEVGIKSRFFDNKLQINADAYYYDDKNYFAVTGAQYMDQVDINDDGDYSDTGLEYEGVVRNETIFCNDDNGKSVGDAKIYGFDITTDWIITNKDRLNLSIAYTESEFTRLYFDFLSITNEQGSPDLDYAGKDRPQSPNWVVSAGYSHNFDLPNGGSITPKFDARYRSEYVMTWKSEQLALDETTYEPIVYDLTKTRYQEAYTIYNFSTTYAHPDGKWTLSAYVKNITNYADKRNWFVMNGGEGTMIIGTPRTYGAVLSVRF